MSMIGDVRQTIAVGLEELGKAILDRHRTIVYENDVLLRREYQEMESNYEEAY